MKKIYVAPTVEVVAIGGQKIMAGSVVSGDNGYGFDNGINGAGSGSASSGLSYEIDLESFDDNGW
ncbi:MAG: hypothetical protein MSA13_04260 [Prevotella sp.]|nr:hypothetical protein [Prevotella sp.]